MLETSHIADADRPRAVGAIGNKLALYLYDAVGSEKRIQYVTRRPGIENRYGKKLHFHDFASRLRLASVGWAPGLALDRSLAVSSRLACRLACPELEQRTPRRPSL